VSPRPRSRDAPGWGFGVVSFALSVAPRAPLPRSEATRRRLGLAPRAGARTHASARRAGSQRTGRPTARVALCVRLRARSWCAPYPPARGLKARERRARGDGRDDRNDANPPTKSGVRTRPQPHREVSARGLPAPADSARHARRASAHPLVVCALPAGAGPRSERAARGGRRTGRTTRRQPPNEERRANTSADSPRVRGVSNFRAGRPRVVLGVRPLARSWCAPHSPARGLGAREWRARGDGRDERNDAKSSTKSAA
jgi:hypothetical protein